MVLEGRRVVLYLSHRGRRGLRQAGLEVADGGGIVFEVRESSEQGLWVQIDYEDGAHMLLIRWDHIDVVDVIEGKSKAETLVH